MILGFWDLNSFSQLPPRGLSVPLYQYLFYQILIPWFGVLLSSNTNMYNTINNFIKITKASLCIIVIIDSGNEKLFFNRI